MTIWSAEITELKSVYTALQGKVHELEKELGQLLKADDENVALLYSRRCLEVMVTDLCETELNRPRKTEPLKGIIDKLNKEEKVPAHIITSMLNLNSLSAYGTHPKEFDPEQVKPVLNNLSTIIKWYLKYKNVDYEVKIAEPESERTDDAKETIPDVRPRKKSLKVVSGILLIGVILVIALDPINISNKDKLGDIRE